MSERINVRAATPSDFAQVDRLFEQLDALHRKHVPWLFCEPRTPARTASVFAQWCSSSEGSVWVAVCNHDPLDVLGVATVLLRNTPDLPIFVAQRFALLDNVVVAAGSRRLGIGTQLLGAAEAWAQRVGAAWVQIEMHAFNEAAEAFYVAHGYLPLTRKVHKPLAPRGAPAAG